MEDDDAVLNGSPDISVNHTNTKEKSSKKRISIISIILVILILGVMLCIILKIAIKKDDFNLAGDTFNLSDKSVLSFEDEEMYTLSYTILDEVIEMKGRYRFTYEDTLNENLKYQYQSYIAQFTKEDYVLCFLELQNEELYVNDVKSENGYINTYYILMAYYDEDNEFVLEGYNVDTGIKITFQRE